MTVFFVSLLYFSEMRKRSRSKKYNLFKIILFFFYTFSVTWEPWLYVASVYPWWDRERSCFASGSQGSGLQPSLESSTIHSWIYWTIKYICFWVMRFRAAAFSTEFYNTELDLLNHQEYLLLGQEVQGCSLLYRIKICIEKRRKKNINISRNSNSSFCLNISIF